MPAAKKSSKSKPATKTAKLKPKTKAKPKVTAKAKSGGKTPKAKAAKAAKSKASAKTVKAHLKSVPKAKAKAAPAKPKSKIAQVASSAPSLFWKLLEARKKQKEERNAEHHAQSQGDGRGGRDKYHNTKHARFGRFAGPRRKAA